MREPARRFMAPNGRTVTQPLRELPVVADEPEVVDRIREATSLFHEPEFPSKATVEALADLGRTHDRLRHAAEVEQAHAIRGALTVEQRMMDAQRRAKLQRVDVSHELHIMRQMVDRARKGGRHDPPAALARIERVEAVLDYRPDLEEAA